MKKLSIIFAFVLACTIASHAAIRWGATVGAGQNTMKFKQDLVTVDKTFGGQAGIIGELMFPGIGVGLDLGLRYNLQGAKIHLGERKVWSSLGYGTENVMFHNIAIPVHIRLKYTNLNGLEEKIAPLVFAGPEFNIQVAHNNASAFKCSGGDLGLTVGGGAELFRKWQLTFSFTWGMTYIAKTKLLDEFSARSRQWTVSVVRYF